MVDFLKRITPEYEMYDDSEMSYMLSRITRDLDEPQEIATQASNDTNISRDEFMKTMAEIAGLLGKLIVTIRELPRPEVTVNPKLEMPPSVENTELFRDERGMLLSSRKTIRPIKPTE